MKCEVIRDLIPLYVEKLCSDENESFIEEHLTTCKDCKKYLDNVMMDISIPSLSEKEIEDGLLEKDLLSKSKQRKRRDTFKKILIVFNLISISITTLSLFLGVFIMFKGTIKYPALHFTYGINILYTIGFVVGLLPIIIGVFELKSLKKYKTKHYIRKFILNLSSQIITMQLSFIIFMIMFMIIPPLDSQTNRVNKYLNVDKDVNKYHDIYHGFLPLEIPHSATNVEYHYKKYTNIINTNLQINFSMVLPEADYLVEKNRVMEDSTSPIDGEENAFKVKLRGVRYPAKVNLEFRFDDLSNKVTYYLYLDDN